MKKKTRKRSLCLLLAAALLLTSIPFDMTTSSKAEEKGTVVRDGEYTTGIFAGEYGIDQLFDYVMMTSTLKGLPYDASWGTANASTGHQFTKSMMADRHFVLKYSGDSNYPLALCLYEDDGTPVVSSRNKGLKSSSKIGLSTNVCLTTTASTYMKKNYTDGIEGVMALCSMGEADSKGLYFKSKNGFGYYLSGSQGRDVGEKIVWEDDANTSVTMDELAEMKGYSSNSLESGQYAVIYNSEGGQQVLDMPEEQTKEKDVDLTLSENVPTRKGYRFIEWNTKEDGSGTEQTCRRYPLRHRGCVRGQYALRHQRWAQDWLGRSPDEPHAAGRPQQQTERMRSERVEDLGGGQRSEADPTFVLRPLDTEKRRQLQCLR